VQEARSTVTGEVTTAWDFSRLPAATIAAQRGSFICVICGGPAHFRKASSNGHDACFVGRPHADNCELAVRGEGPWGPEGDEVVQRWQADRTRIVLTLASDADEPGQGGNGAARDRRSGGRHVGGGEPVGTRIQRGPQRLLHMLMTSNVFRTSTVEIVLPNGTSMPANQFFVSFDNATPDRHADHYHGYWGLAVATSTWQADGSVYVNTTHGRNRDRLALNIRHELLQQAFSRFRLNGHDQMRGKYILAFGEPYVTNGGQFTLYIDNPAHMGITGPGVLT